MAQLGADGIVLGSARAAKVFKHASYLPAITARYEITGTADDRPLSSDFCTEHLAAIYDPLAARDDLSLGIKTHSVSLSKSYQVSLYGVPTNSVTVAHSEDEEDEEGGRDVLIVHVRPRKASRELIAYIRENKDMSVASLYASEAYQAYVDVLPQYANRIAALAVIALSVKTRNSLVQELGAGSMVRMTSEIEERLVEVKSVYGIVVEPIPGLEDLDGEPVPGYRPPYLLPDYAIVSSSLHRSEVDGEFWYRHNAYFARGAHMATNENYPAHASVHSKQTTFMLHRAPVHGWTEIFFSPDELSRGPLHIAAGPGHRSDWDDYEPPSYPSDEHVNSIRAALGRLTWVRDTHSFHPALLPDEFTTGLGVESSSSRAYEINEKEWKTFLQRQGMVWGSRAIHYRVIAVIMGSVDFRNRTFRNVKHYTSVVVQPKGHTVLGHAQTYKHSHSVVVPLNPPGGVLAVPVSVPSKLLEERFPRWLSHYHDWEHGLLEADGENAEYVRLGQYATRGNANTANKLAFDNRFIEYLQDVGGGGGGGSSSA